MRGLRKAYTINDRFFEKWNGIKFEFHDPKIEKISNYIKTKMKNLETFPVLQTERLTLREITEADLDDFFALFSDYEILKFYGMRPYKSPEDASGFMGRLINKFRTKSGIRWAISLKGQGELIGTIGYKYWDTRSRKTEVSYELKPEYWNKGYITEALNKIIEFGFENGLNRIEAWDMKGNVASRRVLEKSGFTYEGTWRDHTYWDGKYYDIEWFSILRREWQEPEQD